MRNITNITAKDAKKDGWKIHKLPNDKDFEVIAKATYEKNGQKIMKSTKRFKCLGGWIYNTSTEFQSYNGEISVAEALAFVPEPKNQSTIGKFKPQIKEIDKQLEINDEVYVNGRICKVLPKSFHVIIDSTDLTLNLDKKVVNRR